MEGAATGPEQHDGGETDGGGSEDKTATCVHNRQAHMCAECGAAGSGKGADKEQEVQGEPSAERRGPYAKVRGPYKKKTCPSCGNRVKKCVCAHNIGLSVPGYCWWSLPFDAMTTARPPSFDPASAAAPAAARRGRKGARSAASCTGESAPAAPLPGSSATVQAPGEKRVSAGESALTPSQPPPPPFPRAIDASVDR